MSKDNNSDQIRLLSEILKWIKFTGMKEVKSTLTNVLDTDAKKRAYQESDGTKGTVELANLVDVSQQTIHNMWEAWHRMGLGESIPVRGGSRFKRSFDLEDFGIEIPEVRVTKPPEGHSIEPTEQKSEAPK
ncbi:hypothetical protein MUP77_11195 [Candidatus Bathyarchaeota archaeon]|nr:hypothetical protein [Candidatus Bathyarchaeota archaeon]